MFHIMAHLSFIVFPITQLLLLLDWIDQVVFPMNWLLLLSYFEFVEISKVKSMNVFRILIIKFSMIVKFIVFKNSIIGEPAWRIIKLSLSMHKILIKLSYIGTSRRKIKFSLTLFLSVHIHSSNISRLCRRILRNNLFNLFLIGINNDHLFRLSLLNSQTFIIQDIFEIVFKIKLNVFDLTFIFSAYLLLRRSLGKRFNELLIVIFLKEILTILFIELFRIK